MENNTVIIAGANGFMGSRLVAEALRAEATVIALARNNNGESAEKRVLLELEENLSPAQIEKYAARLQVFSYDITRQDIGLPQDVIEKLRREATVVFNLVGNTNFFPKNIDDLTVTNVQGPINLIKAVCSPRVRFNHVSTAYVSGKRAGTIYEKDLDAGQEFKNYYEKSKMEGEKTVVACCTKAGIPYSIFRPSIVIRKYSRHGKSPNLNHFYSFVGLIDILRQDAQNETHAGKKEKLNIEVRFPGLRNSTLNFVDLDYAVESLYYIGTRKGTENKTYHLVNPHPLTNQQFIDIIMKLYNINGFSIIENVKEFAHLNFYERLIKRGLQNYIDYFFVNAQFDDSNTRQALQETTIACPEFNKEYIARATGHFS